MMSKMSVIALLLSAVVGYILYFLFVLETTPQWITGNRSFVPESGGLEMISYWAMRGEDYMVKPKDYSVLCIHGAWNSALVWDLGEHEKYFEEENNNFLEKFATDFGYNSHALSFRFHGNSYGKNTTTSGEPSLVPDCIARRLARIGDYVEDTRSALEHVLQVENESKRLVLLCHDMGCYVTMKLLEKYGNCKNLMQRVAGIVMLSPIGYNGNFVRTVRDVLLPNMTFSEIARSVLLMDASHMMSNPRNTKNYYFPTEVSMKMGHRFHEKLVESESLLALFDMTFSHLVNPDKIRANLLSLGLQSPLPVYILFSENDKLISGNEFMETINMFRSLGPDLVSTKFEQLMPNIEVAHHMMYGDKWKTVYGLIIDFLRKLALHEKAQV